MTTYRTEIQYRYEPNWSSNTSLEVTFVAADDKDAAYSMIRILNNQKKNFGNYYIAFVKIIEHNFGRIGPNGEFNTLHKFVFSWNYTERLGLVDTIKEKYGEE